MSEISITKRELELIRFQAQKIWQDLNVGTAIEGKALTASEQVTISWVEAVSGFLKVPVNVKLDVPDSDPDTYF